MTDVRLRITKVQRDELGFYTANVTVAGLDTVRVDTAIGCWTIPRDPKGDHRHQVRREILPEFAALLWKRVRAFERGEHHDDVDEAVNGRPAPVVDRTRTMRGRAEIRAEIEADPADLIAAAMAKAGAAAVRQAA
jgi:hypothetical protein